MLLYCATYLKWCRNFVHAFAFAFDPGPFQHSNQNIMPSLRNAFSKLSYRFLQYSSKDQNVEVFSLDLAIFKPVAFRAPEPDLRLAPF